MNIIDKYLERVDEKSYLKAEIAQLSDEEKTKLAELTKKYEECHAKEPLKRAYLSLDNPSTSYFSLLRDLILVVEDVEGCLEDAEECGFEYCTEVMETAEEITEVIGEEKFKNFMKAYMMGAMWQITNLLDEGNMYNEKETGWALLETKEDSTILTDTPLCSLHESIVEFKEEIDEDYLNELFGK